MYYSKIDFVIAGQPKSGTTALAHFLAQHPYICLSRPKEPGYFATDLIQESDDFHGKKSYFMIRTQSEYNKCFKHCEEGQITGEATVIYAYSTQAAQNIYQHNPEAKIIIMLRNPIDFIHSMHMQLVNTTTETERDFEQALKLEQERKQGRQVPQNAKYPSSLFYLERAKYYEQLRRFYDTFPPENILAITNEEFRQDNAATLQKVLGFLEVDIEHTPDFQNVHGSKQPRSQILNHLIHSSAIKKNVYHLLGAPISDRIGRVARKISLKEQSRTELKTQTRKWLKQELLYDMRKTSNLTGKDLIKEWKLDDE